MGGGGEEEKKVVGWNELLGSMGGWVGGWVGMSYLTTWCEAAGRFGMGAEHSHRT